MSKVKQVKYDEWIKEVFPMEKPKPPDAFTVREIMEKSGFNETTVRRGVDKKVKNGELELVYYTVNNKKMKCFRPIKKMQSEKQKK